MYIRARFKVTLRARQHLEKKLIIIHSKYFASQLLPVHPSAWVGQSLFSTDNPTQSSPPFAGGGLVQVRVRFEKPCKQYWGSEHAVQLDHSENPPSIAPLKINFR